MTARTIFNNLPETNPATVIDQQFADFVNWVIVPCTATGVNNLILTPYPLIPTLAAYAYLNLFSFVAPASSTNLLFAQVGNLASLPVYLNDGLTQAGGPGTGVVAASPYFLQFSASLNLGNGGFYLLPVAQSQIGSGVPTGSIEMFGSLAIPPGWLYCNGQAVSRTGATAPLFAVLGTLWGAGDGSTTFNVPDFRGWFPRGFDDGVGLDPGRAFASTQQDQFQTHVHGYNGFSGAVAGSGSAINAGAAFTLTTAPQTGTFGSETRPKNVAVIFIVKT
jgi:microcystin-dependent protein